MDQGLYVQSARPASITQFNQHPKGDCRNYHPGSVQWIVGCSIHRGVLDENGRCELCLREKKSGVLYHATPLRETVGYPGDEFL